METQLLSPDRRFFETIKVPSPVNPDQIRKVLRLQSKKPSKDFCDLYVIVWASPHRVYVTFAVLYADFWSINTMTESSLLDNTFEIDVRRRHEFLAHFAARILGNPSPAELVQVVTNLLVA